MELIRHFYIWLRRFITQIISPNVRKPIRVIQEAGTYFLVFKSSGSGPHQIAKSSDGLNFTLDRGQKLPKSFVVEYPCPAIVADFKHKDKRVMYFGDRYMHIGYSKDGHTWESTNKSCLNTSSPVEVAGAFLMPHGIVVVYLEKTIEHSITVYKAYLAQFDKNQPDQLLWKTREPVWSSKTHWPGKVIIPLGSAMIDKVIVLYWWVDSAVLYSTHLAGFPYDPQSIQSSDLKLQRHGNNPIVAPRASNAWEAFTTLNPASAYIDGKVHILYRAQGFDYISTVGYAISSDGVHVDRRLDYPIYGPTAEFEVNKTGSVNPKLMSAGGYGGCEDPRITVIDNRLYMIYVAFDGWANLRLAMTSIHIDDFLSQRWNWEKPVLISPPNIIDKSGCLLPEKINGKYVIFHRVFPNILIDYVDDLNFKGDNKWLYGEYQIKVRPGMWDSRKIGAGAPPIKTKEGWLLIYYGVDDRDASRYKIGAMLLDLNDPSKVLYRSSEPILSPDEMYENNGFKPGIVYPCGAVVVNNKLMVYYGAADSVVCVAQADLDTFLHELIRDETTHLFPVQIKEVNYS